MTEKEIKYALAKSPDTTYSYRDDFNHKPGYDTGYIIYNSWNTFYQTENWFYKKNWTIPTRRKTNDYSYHYDEDRDHMVSANVPVRVLDHNLECNTKSGGWNGALLVSPLGTGESFYVDASDFTLKDYKKMSLPMKAKCGFLTKAAYVPTTDPNKIPLAPNKSEELKFPKNPLIIVDSYDYPTGRAYCKVFDPRTKKETNAGLFDFSTLKEVE